MQWRITTQSAILYTITQVEWGAGCLALRTRNGRLKNSFNTGGERIQPAPQHCGHVTRGVYIWPNTPIPIY